MRTRIDVTFTAGTRSIDTGIADLTIEDIRLIVNETQKKVLCSSMQKDLITSVTNGVVTYVSTFPVLAVGDHITFEIDQCTSLDNIQHETELIGDFFGLTDFTQYTPATQQEIEDELEDIMSAIDPDYQPSNL